MIHAHKYPGGKKSDMPFSIGDVPFSDGDAPLRDGDAASAKPLSS